MGGVDKLGIVSDQVQVKSLMDLNQVKANFELQTPRFEPIVTFSSDSKRLLVFGGLGQD